MITLWPFIKAYSLSVFE